MEKTYKVISNVSRDNNTQNEGVYIIQASSIDDAQIKCLSFYEKHNRENPNHQVIHNGIVHVLDHEPITGLDWMGGLNF